MKAHASIMTDVKEEDLHESYFFFSLSLLLSGKKTLPQPGRTPQVTLGQTMSQFSAGASLPVLARSPSLHAGPVGATALRFRKATPCL